MVVSPDGKTLAFSAVDEQGITQLWLRPLDAQQAMVLDRTEDAAKPFWSYDGQLLAFAADGKLKKIYIAGGTPAVLADGVASESGGGTWNADGTILFSKELFGPIYRLNARGGEVTTTTKMKSGEISHGELYFLPDGKHFTYSVSRSAAPPEIRVGELDRPEQDGVAIVVGQMPEFASDHMLFSRDGHIMAQRFDAGTWKVSGDPRTLGNFHLDEWRACVP